MRALFALNSELMTPLRRVAVLGAGTMGSRIAAHFANAGIPALLLDIVLPNQPNRNAAGIAHSGPFRQCGHPSFIARYRSSQSAQSQRRCPGRIGSSAETKARRFLYT